MVVPSSSDEPDRADQMGAYGFRVTGIEGSAEALGLLPVPAGSVWPELRLRWEAAVADRRPPRAELGEDHATLLLLDGGYVELDRAASTAVVATVEPVTPADLVHPYLAGPAGIFAHWHGWMALHAGAAVVSGGAWGFLGDKEAGKTTTLAFLHDLGHLVVTDDLLVTDGQQAMTGPRTLDLRPETAARRHQQGAHVVRDGERARVHLGPMGERVPLRGWVVLGEGPVPSMDPVPMADRLDVLRPALATAPTDDRLLDLLALPMWRFCRPMRWEHIEPSLDVLVPRLGG